MTSRLVEKYGMLASIATIVMIFAVMLGAPAFGLVAAAAMIAVNGVIMLDVVRA